MTVRLCWRYKAFPFLFPLKDSSGRGAVFHKGWWGTVSYTWCPVICPLYVLLYVLLYGHSNTSLTTDQK